jgi:SAM-dependent methyltransferase
VLDDYYRQTYWDHMRARTKVKRFLDSCQQRDHARSQITFLEPWLEAKQLTGVLDIGAGFGDFLIEVRVRGGKNLLAIEPAAEAAAQLERLGFSVARTLWEDVHKYSLEKGAKPEIRLIRASHVLEHVASPPYFLKRIFEVLSDDGFLLCEVPNDGNELLLLAETVRGADVPHLQFFNARSLTMLLKLSRFDVLEVATFGNEPRTRQARITDASRSVKALLPYGVTRVVSDVRRIGQHVGHKLVPRLARPSWKRNPNGVWLRAVARKCLAHR